MPSVVEKETIIGSNISRTLDGFADTAVFYVTGLDAVGSQKKFQAITTPGIPQPGNPHPFISGIQVLSIPSVKLHKGGFSAMVTVNYGVPPDEDSSGGGGGPDGSGSLAGTVRLGAVYERLSSNYAVNTDGSRGDLIKVGADLGVVADLAAGQSYSQAEELTEANTQVGEVDIFVPRVTVIKRGNTIKCPLLKAQKTGFTNSDAFLNGIAGLFDGAPDGTADTWLLIRSSANSTDNNASFDFEFEWAYNPAKWYGVATFIDPASGRPPANTGTPQPFEPGARGNGTLVVRIAGQTAFAPYVSLS
jgi:hypothetical protein